MLVSSLFSCTVRIVQRYGLLCTEASQSCRETSFFLPFPVTRGLTVAVPHTSPGLYPPTSVRHLQTTMKPRKGVEFPGLQNNVYWNLPSSPLNTLTPSQIWGTLFGTVDQEDRGRLFTTVHGGRRRNCSYKLRWDIHTGYNKNIRGKKSMKLLWLSLPCSYA